MRKVNLWFLHDTRQVGNTYQYYTNTIVGGGLFWDLGLEVGVLEKQPESLDPKFGV